MNYVTTPKYCYLNNDEFGKVKWILQKLRHSINPHSPLFPCYFPFFFLLLSLPPSWLMINLFCFFKTSYLLRIDHLVLNISLLIVLLSCFLTNSNFTWHLIGNVYVKVIHEKLTKYHRTEVIKLFTILRNKLYIHLTRFNTKIGIKDIISIYKISETSDYLL